MRLLLNYKAYAKMYHYVQSAPGEVSGFGRIYAQHDATNGLELIVKDVRILDQECDGAYTELTEEAMTDFLVTLAKTGRCPSEWRFWWHSHANFGVGWSGVDEANIQRHCQDTWYTSLCMNKAGAMVARFDHKETRKDIPIVVLPTVHLNIQRLCAKQVLRKVKHSSFLEDEAEAMSLPTQAQLLAISQAE